MIGELKCKSQGLSSRETRATFVFTEGIASVILPHEIFDLQVSVTLASKERA